MVLSMVGMVPDKRLSFPSPNTLPHPHAYSLPPLNSHAFLTGRTPWGDTVRRPWPDAFPLTLDF